jgi:hypothetical protein
MPANCVSDILLYQMLFYWRDWIYIIVNMQLQAKPKYYADFNKHMDEAYYNYEAYDIEYGYSPSHSETLTDTKSSPKLARESTRRSTWGLLLLTTKMS